MANKVDGQEEMAKSGQVQQEAAAKATGANQQASASNSSSQLENIKVAVRLRPFTEREKQRNSKRIVDIELNTVALYNPKSNGVDSVKKFTFDYSYWSHDGFKRNAEGVNVPDEAHPNHSKYVGQERVFEDLGAFLLQNAMQGYNSALLAYGQTGSGKSYTVSGYGQNEGILPRFARALFVELDKRASQTDGDGGGATGDEQTNSTKESEDTREPAKNRYEVCFSMIEIYNEVVRDLLARDHQVNLATAARRGLKVREHPKRGFFVEGLSSYPCQNKEEIERRIEEGQLNKSIAATSMNETSSRGHTIYEFRIKQFRASADEKAPRETLTTSVVQLVDLAGSERLAVHVTGQLGGDSFIGSRSSSPYSQLGGGGAGHLQRTDDSNLNINGSSTMSRAKSVGRKVPPTSASSTGSSSTATTAANQQQHSSSLRRQLQQQPPSSFALSANVDSHQQRFKESVSINQSLSALGNCIQVLSQFSQQMDNKSINSKQLNLQQQPKIPYRDSVLTKLLNRCCLSGNSKVVIIATLSPADANFDDTLSTLRFADRAKQIKTHATVNRTSDTKMVNDLQRENQRLKQMIDGRVTRSDDSSQTSNFDDSENMIDNFNGPGGSSSSSNGPAGRSARTKQATSSSSGGADQPAGRSRTTIRRPAGGAKGAQAGPPTRNKSRSRSQRLAGASSNPSLAMDEQQMRRIVSPAAGKLIKEAEDKEATSKGSIKKSRSMGTGLAPGTSSSPNKRTGSYLLKQHDGDNNEGDAEAEEEEDEDIELAAVASNLLDEIDLNELADIEEGGLLSPDSDDSFAALAEENLTNEEKISILNKLLSNSNVANKIRKQYEMQHKNLLQQQQNPLARPNRSRPNHRLDEENIQRVSAISSSLKQTNPYLSNLNQDEQLTGMIAYIIKQGEMIVGKNNECDILLYGPELRGRHAKITRVAEGDTSRVFIEPIIDEQLQAASNGQPSDKAQPTTTTTTTSKPADDNLALMVNGNPVQLNQRQELHHCDRILFGSNAYFVFIDHANGGPSATVADQDLVTYDMAHNEVLRKVMSEAKIEAVIKDINNYTHRPGTGKHKPKVDESSAANNNNNNNVDPKLSRVKSSRLMRSMTIHGDQDEELAPGQSSARRPGEQVIDERPESRADSELDKQPPQQAGANGAVNEEQDYREKLMEDTYEYAMPVAEVNAIAKEMQIKVTYGLKILTGEEQLPEMFGPSSSSSSSSANIYNIDSNGSDDMSSIGGGSLNGPDNKEQQQQQQQQQQHQRRVQSSSSYEHQATSATTVSNSIKPDTLDIPPALYIHVRLEEQQMDFYWSKEKFQARRFQILELYGAWDVGGKSALVEHLIEQSKYQADYMIDPFIDDPQLSQVLIGHAQVTLTAVAHRTDSDETYDILDLNDEFAGTIRVQVVPCRPVEGDNDSKRAAEPGDQFRPLTEQELHEYLVENPDHLLGQRLIFMIKIICCQNVHQKYRRVYCQYTLNRDKSLIRTNLSRDRNSSAMDGQDGREEQRGQQVTNEMLNFNHSHYVAIDRVNQDQLDFFQHGFLPIQIVGQYDSRLSSTASGQQPNSSSSSSAANTVAPTLITTIINSINKYKFRIEQQQQQHQNGASNFNGLNNYSSSIYTNSVTDSAKSNRVTSSAMMNSNSGASSVASTSATVNLFDQQNDDDEGINSMNGLSQENIIDMILTKRKLDRAENQLHYLKRTINIAEHYNKKHIPVKTVKKLLNSYGHEIEGGSLEEMVADVNVKGRAANTKHSACIVQ